MSTTADTIKAQVAQAMRAGEAFRRDTLRLLVDAIQKAEKRDQCVLAEEEVAGVLAREAKTRRESIEAYRGAGREDLAVKEEAELAIISEFLPAALTDEEIAGLLAEAVNATGAAGPRDMGKVMGYLTPRTRGRVDGAALAARVRAVLGG